MYSLKSAALYLEKTKKGRVYQKFSSRRERIKVCEFLFFTHSNAWIPLSTILPANRVLSRAFLFVYKKKNNSFNKNRQNHMSVGDFF